MGPPSCPPPHPKSATDLIAAKSTNCFQVLIVCCSFITVVFFILSEVQAKNISFKQIESLLFDLTQKSSDKAAKGVIRTKTIEDVHVTTFKQGQMGFISVQNSGKSSR